MDAALMGFVPLASFFETGNFLPIAIVSRVAVWLGRSKEFTFVVDACEWSLIFALDSPIVIAFEHAIQLTIYFKAESETTSLLFRI